MLKSAYLSRSFLVSGALALTATSALAADPVVQQPLVAVAPAAAQLPLIVPAAPAVPAIVELSAQSSVVMTPIAEVSTKKLKVGDTIALVSSTDVKQDGKVVIPAGSKGSATVVAVAGRGAFGRGGEMKMKFDSLQLANGTKIELSGVHTETGARQDTQTASNLAQTGAALAGSFGAVGALVGLLGRAAVSGKSAVIKPGAQLKAFTANRLSFGPNGVAVVTAIATGAAPAPSAIAIPAAGSSTTNSK